MVPANNTPRYLFILESYSRMQLPEWHDKHLGKAKLAAKGSIRAGVSGWGQGNGRNVFSCCTIKDQM